MLEQDSFFKPFVIVMRDILDQGAMICVINIRTAMEENALREMME